jgi:DNA helicase-2/ATP-dependent DNA helicase PcrA
MAITHAQRAAANQQQLQAAQDGSAQVRLIAGPGTGKSRTVEKRVAHVLSQRATSGDVYVISFTRATCMELSDRVRRYCSEQDPPIDSSHVHISTMHSLALKLLRMGNQLNQFPTEPVMLDDWEQQNIYDAELAADLHRARGRAEEVRLAHDAKWQTLNPAFINQAQITPAEIVIFNAFHAARTNLYSCVLPGEVIYRCVTALQQGAMDEERLPDIEHLIVDEFQDLNACDQEFVRLLTDRGAVLFIAGDDDQSIYSFRHADPNGIVQFATRYPQSSTHVLTDCFRCAPAVLHPATQLILHNPNRLAKHLDALYGNAAPPVNGTFYVWSFATADDEAQAIASSCEELIVNGLVGREDEIVILISSRRIQLDILTRELGNRGILFDVPGGSDLADEPPLRAVLDLLRLIEEREERHDDYIAYRTLFSLHSGIGPTTVKNVADSCVQQAQNYRGLFHMQPPPQWLSGRARSAVTDIGNLSQLVGAWSLDDTLAARSIDIEAAIVQNIFTTATEGQVFQTAWNAVAGSLPQDMTLKELLMFLRASSDTDRDAIMTLVNQRLNPDVDQANVPPAGPRHVRILTMHGAKGLHGKVVFIPSVEQGILPSFRNLQAAGLVIEHRRLFYVSVTRAMAACIVSHSVLHTGPQAFALRNQPRVRLPRSQFLNEMGVASVNRAAGLTAAEAAAIVTDIDNL